MKTQTWNDHQKIWKRIIQRKKINVDFFVVFLFTFFLMLLFIVCWWWLVVVLCNIYCIVCTLYYICKVIHTQESIYMLNLYTFYISFIPVSGNKCVLVLVLLSVCIKLVQQNLIYIGHTRTKLPRTMAKTSKSFHFEIIGTNYVRTVYILTALAYTQWYKWKAVPFICPTNERRNAIKVNKSEYKTKEKFFFLFILNWIEFWLSISLKPKAHNSREKSFMRLIFRK